jgi:Zn-dependent M28 family amino/carboxypeptidase
MKIYIRKKGVVGSEGDFFLAERLQKVGAKMTSYVKFEIVANSFNSSDHINFWNNGIKAITYTQDWENDFNKKRYHTPNDFVETLNFKSLYNNFLHISGSVLAWSFDIFR